MEFISPHKYIKNASTNRTILTEHWLNTSRGPRTPKRTRKIPMKLGRMEERRRENEEERKGAVTTPLGGMLKVRRGSRIQGNPLTGGEISWDRRGARGLSEESAATFL